MEERNQRLKALRAAAGLSQRQLASISRITRNRLSLFECGYVQLRDEEYGAAEQAVRDVLIQKRERLRTVLSAPDNAAKVPEPAVRSIGSEVQQ